MIIYIYDIYYSNLRRVPREHSPEMPPPPVEQPPQHESESEEEQYIQPHKQNQDYHEPPVQYITNRFTLK